MSLHFFIFIFFKLISGYLLIISSTSVTKKAPSFINLFGVTPLEFSKFDGTQNTFFSCFFVNSAVTLVPLLVPPSTTNVAIANPLTILFLSKNLFDVAF